MILDEGRSLWLQFSGANSNVGSKYLYFSTEKDAKGDSSAGVDKDEDPSQKEEYEIRENKCQELISNEGVKVQIADRHTRNQTGKREGYDTTVGPG